MAKTIQLNKLTNQKAFHVENPLAAKGKLTARPARIRTDKSSWNAMNNHLELTFWKVLNTNSNTKCSAIP